jgi:putative addiction module component (TIGR02574 family)
MSTEALLNEVRKLTVDERIRFVQEVWESIGADDPGTLVDDETRSELDRRLQDYYADPDTGSPWEEVKARILNKP